MIKSGVQSRFLLCSFLIVCCFFSYTSFGTTYSTSPDRNNISETSLSDVIKEEMLQDEILKANLDKEFRVLAKFSDSRNIHALGKQGKDIQVFDSYDGIAITLTKSELLIQIQNRAITEVWKNSEISFLSDANRFSDLNLTQTTTNFTEKVHASELWEKGFLGEGTKVAILDTGIKTNHPALSQTMDLNEKVVASWNFIEQTMNVEDDNGHGTAVAGIIGSNGLYGYMKGLAPNCEFLIGKILSSSATGTIETLIQGIDWAIENEADVINLSLGKPVSDKNSPEVEAVNNAVKLGIIVCAAAGNTRGIVDFGYNDLFTVLSPGIASQAITVGSIDNNNILYERGSAGSVAVNYNESSSRALFNTISTDETWLKPDILAPGVKLNTTSNSVNTEIVSGTSYATAVVSGVCLLLLQAYVNTAPSIMKSSFLETSQSLNIEMNSPFNETISHFVSTLYQGAGVINASSAFDYLLNASTLFIWPSRAPFTRQNYFLNSQDSFIFHLFINKEIESLQIRVSDTLSNFITISNIPTTFNIGQYDLNISISTERAYQRRYSSYVSFIADEVEFRQEIDFTVHSAKGRILLDCDEIGDDIFYSLYGSLFDIIDISRGVGLIPLINSKDENSKSFSSLDLNNYEVIALMNFNNSIYHTVSNDDLSVLSDYLLPNGNYGAGALLILPSTQSDLLALNNLLTPLNISYLPLLEDNKSLDFSSYYNILSTEPNIISDIFIPYPFNITSTNETYLSLDNSFVYANLRLDNGSLLIAANNIDMFLNSPYLYSSETSKFDELMLSANFGSNRDILENLLFATSVRSLLIEYDINTLETEYKDNVLITINIYNQYKTIQDWNFYMSLDKKSDIIYRFYDFEDFSNGTYLISFNPFDYSVTPGEYILRVRSFSGTKSWTINILAKVSWGPIIVELSLVVSVVFLIFYRQVRLKK